MQQIQQIIRACLAFSQYKLINVCSGEYFLPFLDDEKILVTLVNEVKLL